MGFMRMTITTDTCRLQQARFAIAKLSHSIDNGEVQAAIDHINFVGEQIDVRQFLDPYGTSMIRASIAHDLVRLYQALLTTFNSD